MPALDQNQSLILDTTEASGPFVESIQSNLDDDASFYIKNVKQLTVAASIPPDHYEKILGVCTGITDLCVHDIVNREGPTRQVFDPVFISVLKSRSLQRLAIRATYLPPLWHVLSKARLKVPFTHLTLDVNTVPDAVAISMPNYSLHQSDVSPSLTHILLRFNPTSQRELISILNPGEICENVLGSSPPTVSVLAVQIAEVERSFLRNEAEWKPDTTMPPGATDPRCVYVSEVNGGSVSSSAPSDDVWQFADGVIERRRDLSLAQLSLSAEKEVIELPPDILRVIFEMVVESEKAVALPLMQVCKMAQEWIEPLPYHSLTFDAPEDADAFVRSSDARKDATFFAQHIKQLSLNVAIGVENMKRLLILCTGVTDLCIKDIKNREGPVQLSFNIIYHNIAYLPNLKRLSVRSTYLPPIWSRLERGNLTLSITHLTLDVNNIPDSVKLGMPFFLGKETVAPSLTHILVRINPSSAREVTTVLMPGLICQNILSNAPRSLRVLAVQMSQRQTEALREPARVLVVPMSPRQMEALREPAFFRGTQIPGAKDLRCVHVVNHNGVSSYAPAEAVWNVAEREVERRLAELGEDGSLERIQKAELVGDYIQRCQDEMAAAMESMP